jgi:hypothetical protein
MKRLIEFLFSGCFHEWGIIEKLRYYKDDKEVLNSISYVLQCKKCGNIKTTNHF